MVKLADVNGNTITIHMNRLKERRGYESKKVESIIHITFPNKEWTDEAVRLFNNKLIEMGTHIITEDKFPVVKAKANPYTKGDMSLLRYLLNYIDGLPLNNSRTPVMRTKEGFTTYGVMNDLDMVRYNYNYENWYFPTKKLRVIPVLKGIEKLNDGGYLTFMKGKGGKDCFTPQSFINLMCACNFYNEQVENYLPYEYWETFKNYYVTDGQRVVEYKFDKYYQK